MFKTRALITAAIILFGVTASYADDSICRYKDTAKGDTELITVPCNYNNNESYKLGDRSFKIKRSDRVNPNTVLEDRFHATVNGKAGVIEDFTRYSFNFVSDDKTLQFGVSSESTTTSNAYIGVWGMDPKLDCVKHGGEYGDGTIRITKATLNGYEHSCKLTGVSQSDGELLLKGACESEGVKLKAVTTFKILSATKAIINGNVYNRCVSR
jgi:hypothetical protein